MKTLTLVLTAFLLCACGQKHEAIRNCVDETGKISEAKNCTTTPPPGPHRYTWVYAPEKQP